MYKQVTPDQLEVWLADPVTVTFLDCISYCREQTAKKLSDGGCLFPDNSDQTQYNSAYALGVTHMCNEALVPAAFLGRYERPEVANGAS